MRPKQLLLRFLAIFLITGFASCSWSQNHQKTAPMPKPENKVYSNSDTSKIEVSDAEWKKMLDPEVYRIAREKGTEAPWSSPLEHNKAKGTYYCKACGQALFVSDTKFDSGCGWPSFFEPVAKGSIIYAPDHSYNMERTEVMCGRCKAHLGHVFDDGPPPTGLRFCINGGVLDFKAK